jgi:hypothetical protein
VWRLFLAIRESENIVESAFSVESRCAETLSDWCRWNAGRWSTGILSLVIGTLGKEWWSTVLVFDVCCTGGAFFLHSLRAICRGCRPVYDFVYCSKKCLVNTIPLCSRQVVFTR